MNQIVCPWCPNAEPLADTAQNRMWVVSHQRADHRAELGLIEHELVLQS